MSSPEEKDIILYRRGIMSKNEILKKYRNLVKQVVDKEFSNETGYDKLILYRLGLKGLIIAIDNYNGSKSFEELVSIKVFDEIDSHIYNDDYPKPKQYLTIDDPLLDNILKSYNKVPSVIIDKVKFEIIYLFESLSFLKNSLIARRIISLYYGDTSCYKDPFRISTLLDINTDNVNAVIDNFKTCVTTVINNVTKANAKLIEQSREVESLIEYGKRNGYSANLIRQAFNNCNEELQNTLTKLYGEDLNTPNLTYKDREFKAAVSEFWFTLMFITPDLKEEIKPKDGLYKRLEELGYKTKVITEFLNACNKEFIDKLKQSFGKDYNSPTLEEEELESLTKECEELFEQYLDEKSNRKKQSSELRKDILTKNYFELLGDDISYDDKISIFESLRKNNQEFIKRVFGESLEEVYNPSESKNVFKVYNVLMNAKSKYLNKNTPEESEYTGKTLIDILKERLGIDEEQIYRIIYYAHINNSSFLVDTFGNNIDKPITSQMKVSSSKLEDYINQIISFQSNINPNPVINEVYSHFIKGSKEYRNQILLNNPRFMFLLDNYHSMYVNYFDIFTITGRITKEEALIDFYLSNEDYKKEVRTYFGETLEERLYFPSKRKSYTKIIKLVNERVKSILTKKNKVMEGLSLEPKGYYKYTYPYLSFTDSSIDFNKAPKTYQERMITLFGPSLTEEKIPPTKEDLESINKRINSYKKDSTIIKNYYYYFNVDGISIEDTTKDFLTAPKEYQDIMYKYFGNNLCNNPKEDISNVIELITERKNKLLSNLSNLNTYYDGPKGYLEYYEEYFQGNYTIHPYVILFDFYTSSRYYQKQVYKVFGKELNEYPSSKERLKELIKLTEITNSRFRSQYESISNKTLDYYFFMSLKGIGVKESRNIYLSLNQEEQLLIKKVFGSNLRNPINSSLPKEEIIEVFKLINKTIIKQDNLINYYTLLSKQNIKKSDAAILFFLSDDRFKELMYTSFGVDLTQNPIDESKISLCNLAINRYLSSAKKDIITSNRLRNFFFYALIFNHDREQALNIFNTMPKEKQTLLKQVFGEELNQEIDQNIDSSIMYELFEYLYKEFSGIKISNTKISYLDYFQKEGIDIPIICFCLAQSNKTYHNRIISLFGEELDEKIELSPTLSKTLKTHYNKVKNYLSNRSTTYNYYNLMITPDITKEILDKDFNESDPSYQSLMKEYFGPNLTTPISLSLPIPKLISIFKQMTERQERLIKRAYQTKYSSENRVYIKKKKTFLTFFNKRGISKEDALMGIIRSNQFNIHEILELCGKNLDKQLSSVSFLNKYAANLERNIRNSEFKEPDYFHFFCYKKLTREDAIKDFIDSPEEYKVLIEEAFGQNLTDPINENLTTLDLINLFSKIEERRLNYNSKNKSPSQDIKSFRTYFISKGIPVEDAIMYLIRSKDYNIEYLLTDYGEDLNKKLDQVSFLTIVYQKMSIHPKPEEPLNYFHFFCHHRKTVEAAKEDFEDAPEDYQMLMKLIFGDDLLNPISEDLSPKELIKTLSLIEERRKNHIPRRKNNYVRKTPPKNNSLIEQTKPQAKELIKTYNITKYTLNEIIIFILRITMIEQSLYSIEDIARSFNIPEEQVNETTINILKDYLQEYNQILDYLVSKPISITSKNLI